MSLSVTIDAAGDLAAYLDAVEAEARDRFNLTVLPSSDRHRLGHLHGGRPPFPGWFPAAEGGAPDAFWLDFQGWAGQTVATGGACLYKLGPADLASFVNAGGMDAEGHRVRVEAEAAEQAASIRLEAGFSGNLWVDPAHRKTEMSRWLTEAMPLANKAVAASLWPGAETFVTFVRDAQLDHLAPRYRLPILVPGVTWWRRFQGAASLHLGVQTLDELRAATRASDSRPTPRATRTAA